MKYFLKNNFKIRSKSIIHNSNTSSPVGLVRDVIKNANNPNAFETANILVGDFIANVSDIVQQGDNDFLFDDFLAAAAISQTVDVKSPNFKPFFAIVNVPEITCIQTPISTEVEGFNRKVRDIVQTLGVFKLYNYYGQFNDPEYGDPVQVTFADMETFTDAIFIGPIITGQPTVTFSGGSKQTNSPKEYVSKCSEKDNVNCNISKSTETQQSTEASEKKKNAKEKSKPSKPSTSKETSNTPNTLSSPTPTPTSNSSENCKFANFDSDVSTDDGLQWVKINSYGPRVWQSPRRKTQNHSWGTLRMEKFLRGLNNVRGGEDLGKGYKNPVKNNYKGRYDVPDDIRPGWHFLDVSKEKGGAATGHKSHQSGIGVDISIPTKYVDPKTKQVFRGMNIRKKFVKNKKGVYVLDPTPHSIRVWGFRRGEPKIEDHMLDEVALLDFLRYAIPLSYRIIFGDNHVALAKKLIEKYSRENTNGWSLDHPAYKYYKLSKTRVLSGDDRIHGDHFHVRLRGIAQAPLGMDKQNHRDRETKKTGNQGDGRIDKGYPGYKVVTY